jgi:hypothetical protein
LVSGEATAKSLASYGTEARWLTAADVEATTAVGGGSWLLDLGRRSDGRSLAGGEVMGMACQDGADAVVLTRENGEGRKRDDDDDHDLAPERHGAGHDLEGTRCP